MKIKRSLYYSRLIQRVKNMDHRIDHINNEIQKESPNGGEILNSYQGKAVNDAGQIRIDIPFDLLRMPLLPAASTTARVVCNADRHEDVQSADLAFAHLLKRERHRIARDLHDHVGQYIVGVMLRLAAIERRIEDADLRMELSELRPTLLRFTDELKAITHGINLPTGAELIPALSDMISRWESVALIETRFEHEPEGGVETDSSTTEVIFRVVQEALTNIAKHASDATLVTVRLSFTASEIVLTIEDDGRGFVGSPDMYNDCDRVHHGIAGMRERVDEVGGKFKIRSPVNHRGTCVVVTIPLTHH